MKNQWIRIAFVLILLLSMTTSFQVLAKDSFLPAPALSTLQPGGFRTIQQELDINVVFIGFDALNTGYIENYLPETYRTIIRYPAFYGIKQFLGNDFSFQYNFIYASDGFENDFFAWLGGQGETGDLTVFQQDYNDNEFNTLDVTGPVRYINGPMVEQYLETQGESMLGDYTVFFINWYSQPDFQFHLYTKTDFSDPDTGYNFGVERASRKMISWGGSTGRSWFYDFSAGPEAWGGNFLIDPPSADYTIPPIWEYGNPNAYRPFDDLEGDMTRLIRFVGIDLLFTPSPLYKPLLSPPKLPNTINLDLNLFEGEPGFSGLDSINVNFIQEQYDQLQPYKTYSVDLNDYPLDGRLSNVFDCFAEGLNSCFGKRLWNIAFADLFLYAEDHLIQYLDGNADYEIPIFLFNIVPEKMGDQFGLLGFADDNWRDGTQSFIFEFGNEVYRSLGYGFSWTTAHEGGHHIGFSHPHDGYDFEWDYDFGPGGETYFAWLGDESDTVMHYLNLSPGFGKFNQDSMYRYETVGYINEANAILASIYAKPNSGSVSSLLLNADNHAASALTKYETMDYLDAVTDAKTAYESVLEAAAILNILVEPQAWQADYKSHGQTFFVDPIRFPNE